MKDEEKERIQKGSELFYQAFLEAKKTDPTLTAAEWATTKEASKAIDAMIDSGKGGQETKKEYLYNTCRNPTEWGRGSKDPFQH